MYSGLEAVSAEAAFAHLKFLAALQMLLTSEGAELPFPLEERKRLST